MAPLRIFIADDHEVVRQLITALLSFHKDWEICGEAAEGGEAVERVGKLKPDVVLLDIDLPGLDGLETTRQILQRRPNCKVIVLPIAVDEKLVRDIFKAGASGFVLKDKATHDLVVAIQAIQRGQTFFTARFAEIILKSYLQEQAESPATEAAISERELAAVRVLTNELTMTLDYELHKPPIFRKPLKHAAVALLLAVAGGILWYFLAGEPSHPSQAVTDVLVAVGLKSAAPKADPGNPDAKVWIDVHTALYYCAGAEAYGRTPKGRFAKQLDAQFDHFEPASGTVCQ